MAVLSAWMPRRRRELNGASSLLERAEAQVPVAGVELARDPVHVLGLEADVVVPDPGEEVGLAGHGLVEGGPRLRRGRRVGDRLRLLDLRVQLRIVHLRG